MDKFGKVIASNRAWNRFENDDEIESIADSSDDENYLEVRRRAAERKIEEGRKADDGIKSVINGLRHVVFLNCDIPESLSRDIALCIFRIVQEALSNVVKHSGAQEARVELIGSPQAIQLSIVDPGTGFEIELVKKRGGLGLISMQERLRLVGGEISIKSRPLFGTQINVQIPLKPNANDHPSLQNYAGPLSLN
ncbi:MAG: ATP-binding protein [Acidobacteria bacterium]|nr:ATP-binding protein [Acidobacteriota bacterium]